ncbi:MULTISPECIES: AlbA family DNA-binding domain-containing protein [unclassified Mesorhizobium]|uniref:AlbA family DNA-binding domain-containing protein n=1 Tax=unclassified Mesorhizobium TaxID=325217 RepID=UPI000464ABFE|nr:MULTISPECIES: ATP-binding protein [unclassified Mesorhizobium]
MIQRPIDAIDERDLAELIANKVAEGRDLEFKRALPGGSEADGKEFLADVTAFANAQGGDLIFGVEETAGAASAVPGLAVNDPDAELLRIESRIRDGVEPRLTGLRMRWISLASGLRVLIVRVPASLSAPHRVVFKNSGRFFSRNSGGKYEMDTHELRHAFTISEQLPTRLRAFHVEAVAAAQGVNMPFRLNPEPMAVASVVPLSILRERQNLDITPETALAPVKPSGTLEWMFTLDGLLLHTPLNENTKPETNFNAVRSYALTHWQGRTDVAWTLGGERQIDRGAPRLLVWPHRFEAGLIDVVVSTMAKLRSFAIEGPWVVFVSISGIEEAELVLGDRDTSEPAWREGATLPEVVADHLDESALLPIFKAFWLLFGVPRPKDRVVSH